MSKVPKALPADWEPKNATEAHEAMCGFVDQCVKAGVFPNLAEALKARRILDLLKPEK
jgi:hypothetical protein